MNCSICQKRTTSKEIEPNLTVHECEDHGIWLPALNYWRWMATENISYPPVIVDGEYEASEIDSKSGKACSSCGQFLQRFAVGHGVAFHVDQCSKCMNIWLDKGEWEILKEKNLHNAIHFMFSEPWQNRVQEERDEAQYQALFRSKLGDELFETIYDFKKSVSNHEQYNLILTYLSNER